VLCEGVEAGDVRINTADCSGPQIMEVGAMPQRRAAQSMG